MLGVLMPIEELASLTSAVLTWTSCLRLQGILHENQDGNQGFGKPSHKKWLPTPPHHLKILKMNQDLQAASAKSVSCLI